MNFGVSSFDSVAELEEFCEDIESETCYDYKILENMHIYFYTKGDDVKIILAQDKEIVYFEGTLEEVQVLVHHYYQFQSKIVHSQMIERGVL